jgi:hypothetical protein
LMRIRVLCHLNPLHPAPETHDPAARPTHNPMTHLQLA